MRSALDETHSGAWQQHVIQSWVDFQDDSAVCCALPAFQLRQLYYRQAEYAPGQREALQQLPLRDGHGWR